MKQFNCLSNLLGLFLFNVFIAGGLVGCLIAEDLDDLANRLTETECETLKAVMTNQTIGTIKSSCFDFLINQRVHLRSKYPKEGDGYFRRNLTRSLLDIGLKGSAMKLITLDLREKILSIKVNSLSQLEEIRENQETDADDNIIEKNPFKGMYSSSRKHDRATQQSNQSKLDIVILSTLITMAIILTYILIVTVRNLDVPDDLIGQDEVVLRM